MCKWAHFLCASLLSEILVPQFLAALEALNYKFHLPSSARFSNAFLESLPSTVVLCLDTLQMTLGKREEIVGSPLCDSCFLRSWLLMSWLPQQLPHDFRFIFCFLIGFSTFSWHKRWSAASYSIQVDLDNWIYLFYY